MKRENKFRAWNGKHMIDSSYGDWISFDGVSYTQAEKGYDTHNIEIQKAKDYVLMQFTGLLDKNGKEIYEGDIVELEFIGGQIESGVISYFEESAGFKWTSTDPSDKDNYWLNQSDYTLRKVIGNIYENPELLK